MKKISVVVIVLFMFFFKTSTTANYENVFFDFKIKSITGEIINLKDYENKVILLVNTASYCGFTKQYKKKKKLWDTYKSNNFMVLGVASNSFNQEKKNDDDVKDFCEVNFSINFPLSTITEVKGKNAHEIFKWAKSNYGNTAIPKWNFHKILINKEGKIHGTFNSFTNPLSKKITTEIEKIL